MTLHIRRLSKSFGSRRVLDEITFEVSEGEMVAIVGASGSGKSTLLNVIATLIQPTHGAITFNEWKITSLRSPGRRRLRRDVLGLLFQNYALIENETVANNIKIVAPQRRKISETDVDAALTEVGLSCRGQDIVYHLSGGEQQRVALARLLVKNPRLILADEPTGALDAMNTAVVISILRQLAQRGCIVLIATHDPLVEGSCDRAIDLGLLDAAQSVG